MHYCKKIPTTVRQLGIIHSTSAHSLCSTSLWKPAIGKRREKDSLRKVNEEGGLVVVNLTAWHANVPIYLTVEHWECFISSRGSSSSLLDSCLDALDLQSGSSKWAFNYSTIQMLNSSSLCMCCMSATSVTSVRVTFSKPLWQFSTSLTAVLFNMKSILRACILAGQLIINLLSVNLVDKLQFTLLMVYDFITLTFKLFTKILPSTGGTSADFINHNHIACLALSPLNQPVNCDKLNSSIIFSTVVPFVKYNIQMKP